MAVIIFFFVLFCVQEELSIVVLFGMIVGSDDDSYWPNFRRRISLSVAFLKKSLNKNLHTLLREAYANVQTHNGGHASLE